ncbi:MAG: radical SAM protein [Clostridiales bacterium]|nr:radical SAM protein [Clostridiales bacterium]
MKKHAIIPVFIPHKGCPNDCVFCNQKAITARTADVYPEDVEKIINEYLPTLEGRGLEEIEIAFFGGSFTGIPIEEQSAFLEVAKKYKDAGKIDRIHLSTRPDYIDRRILDNLRKYDVDVIELGVQSFDEEVLLASNRGHSVKAVYDACTLIREYGFTLGIQLMIGLPLDNREKSIESARKTVEIGPEIARLYPTVILKDTELYEMYKRGEYTPENHDEMVVTVAEMYKILTGAGINVIRVGLKSTDLINDGDGEDSAVIGNSYHPAFRQLVEGAIAKEKIDERIKEMFPDAVSKGYWDEDPPSLCPLIKVISNSRDFSNIIGHKGVNKKYFENEYLWLNIRYEKDNTLADGELVVVK